MNTYFFQCSKEHLVLAQVEIEGLFNVNCSCIGDGIFLCDIEGEPVFDRLALTKQVGKVLSQTDEDFSNLPSGSISNSYKVDVIGGDLTSKEVADKLHYKFCDGQDLIVDLFSPDHIYFVVYADKVYFTELVFENKVNFDERRSHLLAKNHPTSMHPRIASALINVLGVNSFCDPFCGSGGLVLEGIRMGVDVVASDISEEMIERAKENASFLKLDASFNAQDALHLKGSYEAIITDLPYGKGSFISSDKLYAQFFPLARKLTKKLIVGLPDSVNVELFLGEWKIQQKFEIYVHKSMTRVFYVLM